MALKELPDKYTILFGYYTCIGDGAIRFFIQNDDCPAQEIVLSGADFQCQAGITAADIDECFNETQIDDFYFNATTPIMSNGKIEMFNADVEPKRNMFFFSIL